MKVMLVVRMVAAWGRWKGSVTLRKVGGARASGSQFLPSSFIDEMSELEKIGWVMPLPSHGSGTKSESSSATVGWRC